VPFGCHTPPVELHLVIGMRDYVFLYINGSKHRVFGSQAFLTLSSYLRKDLQATGTKVVCEEGDCGACTVLVGRVLDGRMKYLPVNSCIQYLYQLDGTHVVSVEGLRLNGELNCVQKAMVNNHGAQCGYCTPGFVVAMCGLFNDVTNGNGEADASSAGDKNSAPGKSTVNTGTACDTTGSGGNDEKTACTNNLSQKDIRDALTGNLCRCTGYEPIIRAAQEVALADVLPMAKLYVEKEMIEVLADESSGAIAIEADGRKYFNPQTLEQATEFKGGNPGCAIVQGGTDIAVQGNKRNIIPQAVMSLSRLAQMEELKVEDNVLLVGGKVTLARLEQFVQDLIPELYDMLWVFGSPQIKNAGTLAGNIVNASPIADTIPFLYVTDAELDLVGVTGARRVKVGSFYKGYKKLDLLADEIVRQIRIPLPGGNEILKLYKVSKRKNLDISTFTAAFKMQLAQDKIDSARIAYGGVAPTVLYLPKTEAYLAGKPFAEKTFVEAGLIARGEITPISDVRGDAEYRFGLAETILLKLFHELQNKRELVCR
jgi:xanthine dehydrogenase small subunit